MSKNIMISVLIGVAVLGGGYLVFKNKSSEVSSVDATNNGAEKPTEKKMSFDVFLKQGGSYKCDVKQYLSDMENNGTVYVDAGNIRGEYATVAEGRNIQTSFIMKDGYSYTWSSMAPNMGFKVKVDTTTGTNTDASTQGTYSWDAKQIGDYNCEPWTADQSMFALPANIKFNEIGTK